MTSKSENLIVWQKWFDPLGEDDLDQMEVMESATEPEFYTEEEDEEEGGHIDAVEEEEFYKRPTKVIMTPMGIIPYTENTASTLPSTSSVKIGSVIAFHSFCSLIFASFRDKLLYTYN